MNSWPNDPLLLKELRTRLRARAAVSIEIVYICALLVTAVAIFLVNRGEAAWIVGARLVTALFYAQTFLLLFLAPLVTASAISAEKEQKTFDSLMVTPVSPVRILLNKLAAAMAVFAILVAVSLPFAAAAYLLGGVSPGDLALGWLYTLLLTLSAGVMGLYWSARFERSIASIPAAAVSTVLIAVFGPMLLQHAPGLTALLSPFLERSWIFVFGILAAIAAALFTAAVQRLKFEADRRYPVMRAWSLLAWALVVANWMYCVALRARDASPGVMNSWYTNTMYLTLTALGLVAPWIGASLPVIRSGRAAGRIFCRIAARIMTGPLGFTVLLSAVAVAGFVVLRRLTAPASGIGAVAVSTGLSLVVMPAMFAMLSFRLSDRRTQRGRFMGLAAAWLMALALLAAPPVVYLAAQVQFQNAGSVAQWISLASPYTIVAAADLSPRMRERQFAHVHRTVGDAGALAVAPLFHGLALVILLLPVFPSETARMKKRADRAKFG